MMTLKFSIIASRAASQHTWWRAAEQRVSCRGRADMPDVGRDCMRRENRFFTICASSCLASELAPRACPSCRAHAGVAPVLRSGRLQPFMSARSSLSRCAHVVFLTPTTWPPSLARLGGEPLTVRTILRAIGNLAWKPRS